MEENISEKAEGTLKYQFTSRSLQNMSLRLVAEVFNKKILLVFTNIFVSVIASSILTTFASNIAVKINSLFDNGYGPMAAGFFVGLISWPIFYVLAISVYAKLFVKKNRKENIILSIILPLITLFTIVLLWKLTTV